MVLLFLFCGMVDMQITGVVIPFVSFFVDFVSEFSWYQLIGVPPPSTKKVLLLVLAQVLTRLLKALGVVMGLADGRWSGRRFRNKRHQSTTIQQPNC